MITCGQDELSSRLHACSLHAYPYSYSTIGTPGTFFSGYIFLLCRSCHFLCLAIFTPCIRLPISLLYIEIHNLVKLVPRSTRKMHILYTKRQKTLFTTNVGALVHAVRFINVYKVHFMKDRSIRDRIFSVLKIFFGKIRDG